MATITAYGGVDEIGGNRLLVETDVRIFLDLGTSFRALKHFFHEYLKPRKVSGMADYFRMGLAPDVPGLYRPDLLRQMGRDEEPRGVDAILLSHPHLDHAGLFPLVRPDVPIYTSPAGRAVLQAVQDTSPDGVLKDFLTYQDQFGFVRMKKDAARMRKIRGDERNERPRPVSHEALVDIGKTRIENHTVDHSIPGARGILLATDGFSLAYSGDLRRHGRRAGDTDRFVQRAGGVDYLLMEGTNLGNENKDPDPDAGATKFIPESEVAREVADEVRKADGFCFVNYPPRDLDRLLSFHEAARQTGRRLLLTAKQAHLLELMRRVDVDAPPLNDPNLGVYMPRRGYGLIERPDLTHDDPKLLADDYSDYELPHLGRPYTFSRGDVRRDPRAFLVYVDYYNMTELVDLDPDGGAYIYSKTEPFDEEMELDYARLQHWLDHFRLRLVKKHASGHFPPEDLWHAIDQIRPKKLLPMHTENPKAFLRQYPHKAEIMQYGRSVAA